MKKTLLILGGDGYLGWPLAMKLALQHPDEKIVIVDNQWRREAVRELGFDSLSHIPRLAERIAAFQRHYGIYNIHYQLFDICSTMLEDLIIREQPHTIYHLAQQCSASYSMMGLDEALHTLRNNEEGNMRLLWAVRQHVPKAHIIKLGSFGEYAKGGIPIAEGYFRPSYKGASAYTDLPYPREANDIYHISKINDSNYTAMACRIWNLRITEVMQSTVFGLLTEEMAFKPELYTRFDYDTVFGTVANRFVIQAVSGNPLTIYGNGHQRTGLMALRDAVGSLARFAAEPPAAGEHRVINHVTETHYSINELAADIIGVARKAGLKTSAVHLDDLRKENTDFKAGYEVESSLHNHPLFHSDFREVILETLQLVYPYKEQITDRHFLPFIFWEESCKSPAENSADRMWERFWNKIRKKHFGQPQLNLNPGCLGTVDITADLGTAQNGNPLALYAKTREAFRYIKQECNHLWPSPGYRFTVTYSTSQTMNLLALAMLRKLLTTKKGPFRVVTSKHEHQGGIGPFEQLSEFIVYYLPDEVLVSRGMLEEKLSLLQPDIIFLSHTYYDTGDVVHNNNTLRLLKEAAPDAWLILDVAQSLGIHQIPFGTADLITGSTHKWLFGPYGGGLTWIKHAFAEWIGALFWNGQQLLPDVETHGFSLPGGQDFKLYWQLHQSLDRYRQIGIVTALERSCELADFLRKELSLRLNTAGIAHYYLNGFPTPCLALAFTDYDPYPLYIHLHGLDIHVKCIKDRQKENGETIHIMRIGLPYYETRERLFRFIQEVEKFVSIETVLAEAISLTKDQVV
ncbi:Nucleoside-diphosphate-sugar epimerase [Pedobacter suwonensis]|uniref:Nucleoside-diphosphate-sugar epimerase n=1 Tax=Pedobacter suwonensis TaxID=332999 RepID=A0A1I0TIX3_9SPHI|nr:Nucleoside-diphosphate-sugar epimerase [Pedobacter suwonensis]